MIIDFHTHAFPDAIAQKAIEKLARQAGGLPHYTDGTYSQLKNACNEAGIDVQVVLNIAVKPEQMRRINDAALFMCSSHVIPFGSVHPFAPNALDEVRRLHALGCKGVKLHPEYQDFHVDDPLAFPLYNLLGRLGMITVFHAGADLGFATPPKCTPRALKRALPFFEGGPVIAAHMGGLNAWLEVLDHLVGQENLYFDTSYSHTRIPLKAARQIIDSHGADRVLFGSDSPWGHMPSEISFIRSLGLSETDEKAIFESNARRLLRL